jgi:DNA (cytosine-5)-methyltransferase 1
LNHGSLFSGIGGFDLAAQWMGWNNVFHCEWNPFGQRVLKYYWPDAISYDDICKTDFTIHRGSIDILTGGFPCQPYSVAGKRKGTEDARHLWPEMLRAIRECRPTWIVGENVPGFISWNEGLVFEQVCVDLENEGYEVQPVILPACGVNAPHRRDRVWIVANNDGKFWGERRDAESSKQSRHRESMVQDSSSRITPNATSLRQSSEEHRKEKPRWITKKSISGDWQNFPTVSPICTRDDGIPTGLDGITFPKWRNESIKAGGNAIVPQVAYEIFKVIKEMNKSL